MAKIFRFSGYLIDPNESCDEDDIELSVTEKLGMLSQQLHIESADIGEWDDDNPLNYENCDLAYCSQYFKQIGNNIEFDRPLPQKGEKYKHFKLGKIVTIIGISRHTETEEISVVYDYEGHIWNRPLEMFMSDVDKEKYPNAEQKYRFELIESEE